VYTKPRLKLLLGLVKKENGKKSKGKKKKKKKKRNALPATFCLTRQGSSKGGNKEKEEGVRGTTRRNAEKDLVRCAAHFLQAGRKKCKWKNGRRKKGERGRERYVRFVGRRIHNSAWPAKKEKKRRWGEKEGKKKTGVRYGILTLARKMFTPQKGKKRQGKGGKKEAGIPQVFYVSLPRLAQKVGKKENDYFPRSPKKKAI